MKNEILNKMFEGITPKSIFEVGYSDGVLLEDIGNHLGNVLLGGIEINEKDATAADKRLKKWERTLFKGDARSVPWPIPEKTFDVAFTVGLLMYVRNPLSVIQEMLHVARARVVLAEPIYTESGNIVDTATGIPFDSYGERFNHDYLAQMTGAGIVPERKFFGDKIIYTITKL